MTGPALIRELNLRSQLGVTRGTPDKGHIHTSNTMWRVPTMPASNAYGKRNIGSTIILWALHGRIQWPATPFSRQRKQTDGTHLGIV